MRVKILSQAILLLGLIVAPCLAFAAEPTFKEGWFTTNDGVKLHYLEAGSGNPLGMIPGWSQSAMEFKYQLTGLSDKYHVYAVISREPSLLEGRFSGERQSMVQRSVLIAKSLATGFSRAWAIPPLAVSPTF